jgi:hypothetical protein
VPTVLYKLLGVPTVLYHTRATGNDLANVIYYNTSVCLLGMGFGFLNRIEQAVYSIRCYGTDIKEHHRSYLGRFRERKHRAKNEVEPREHWTLNTTHQFIIITTSMIS